MNKLNITEFHVDHNVKPKHIEAILPCFKEGIYITKKELMSELNGFGYIIHPRHLRKNLSILRYFGILHFSNNAFSITKLGLSIKNQLNFNKDIFHDLMHYLYYTTWDFSNQNSMYFSWSYKTICNLLWERKSTKVNRKRLAGELLALAQEKFVSKEISISHEAITGIFYWLKALTPPFIEETKINKIGSGRKRCSLELFVLSIDYLYHMLGLNYKIPVLLDDFKKELVCKLCLLEENSFNAILSLAIQTFTFIQKHYGEWGSSLILQKRVKIEDLF